MESTGAEAAFKESRGRESTGGGSSVRPATGANHLAKTGPDTWTPERVEALKRLWAEGWTVATIAGQIGGLNRNQVIGKVHRLGLPQRESPILAPRKPRSYSRWSPEEDDRLRSMWAAGAPVRDIAEACGKANPGSVSSRARLLGIPRRFQRLKRGDDDVVRDGFAAGKTIHEIAAALKICPTGLRKFAGRHGITLPRPTIDPARIVARRNLLEKRRAKLLAAAARPKVRTEPDPDCRQPLSSLAARDCHWPSGDPKDPAFGFCGAPAAPGCPYCQHHAALAYTRREATPIDKLARLIASSDRTMGRRSAA